MRKLPFVLIALVLLAIAAAVWFVAGLEEARSPVAGGPPSPVGPRPETGAARSPAIERPVADAEPAPVTAPARAEPARQVTKVPLPSETARFRTGLRGTCLLDPGLATDLLAVQLADPADSTARPLRLRAAVSFDGAWELAHCPPGRFDVRLELEHATEPLHVVREVVVAEDRETPPLELDLRGVLRPCTLEVVDASGAPVGEAIASFYSVDGARQSSVVVREGRALAILVRPPVALDVAAQRHRPFVVEGVDGDLRVELRGAILARFSLANDARLPAAPHQLQCELEPEIAVDAGLGKVAAAILEQRLGLIDDLVFSVDGTNRSGIELALPLPGRYRVVLRVQDVSTGLEESIATASPQRIDVLDGGQQSFELALDAAALEAALARLAKPR